MKKGSKRKDIFPDDKFGMLTILKFSHSLKKRTHWLCKCECGNEITISRKYLAEKRIHNCGCLPRKSAGNQELRNKNEMYEYKWNSIKNLSHWEGECLIWDGYFKGLTPKMTFRNIGVNVRRWIYLYYNNWICNHRFIVNTCGNHKCINIKHIKGQNHVTKY